MNKQFNYEVFAAMFKWVCFLLITEEVTVGLIYWKLNKVDRINPLHDRLGTPTRDVVDVTIDVAVRRKHCQTNHTSCRNTTRLPTTALYDTV